MTDEQPKPPPQPRSPAPRWARAVAAGVFVVIWLVVIIYDFFVMPEQDTVPFWFQASGLLVLGYLLGVGLDDLTPGGRR